MSIDETGALIFGVVVGYITYRTLARTVGKSAISDLAAVVAAIGGGAVAKQYQSASGHQFSWYAIGIAVGMTFFLLLFRVMNGKQATAAIMGVPPNSDEDKIEPSV
jgi:prolipoprotein diacylglyceryltransferase